MENLIRTMCVLVLDEVIALNCTMKQSQDTWECALELGRETKSKA
jgi:hypothetical protein